MLIRQNPNITLISECMVNSLIIKDNVCIGIVYNKNIFSDTPEKNINVLVNNEVIVAGGAINTVKLLNNINKNIGKKIRSMPEVKSLMITNPISNYNNYNDGILKSTPQYKPCVNIDFDKNQPFVKDKDGNILYHGGHKNIHDSNIQSLNVLFNEVTLLVLVNVNPVKLVQPLNILAKLVKLLRLNVGTLANNGQVENPNLLLVTAEVTIEFIFVNLGQLLIMLVISCAFIVVSKVISLIPEPLNVVFILVAALKLNAGIALKLVQL